MTTSLAPQPIGPYFDISALSDYLNKERDTAARLCARKLLDGDIDAARYYAEEFGPIDAAIDRIWAYWDEFKDDDRRWIGWDVQNGFEPSSRLDPRGAVEDPWATPAAVVHTPSGVVELGPEDFDIETEGPALDPENAGEIRDMTPAEELMMFGPAGEPYAELDVVRYDTGTEYFVCERLSADSLLVKGWKNGKPFGALRHISPARCEFMGRAVRPQERGDSWGFVPRV